MKIIFDIDIDSFDEYEKIKPALESLHKEGWRISPPIEELEEHGFCSLCCTREFSEI